jgi:hypothetical protein
MEGATSLAGAVEINSLLMNVGLPSMVILIAGNGTRKPSERALKLSNLLLIGPLRPGLTVDLGREGVEDHENITISDLERSLNQLLKGVEGPSSVRIPPIAWNLLREDGGPYIIHTWLIDRRGGIPDDKMPRKYPSVNVLEVDMETTTSEINEFVTRYLGDEQGAHMGIIEGSPPEGKWMITSVHPAIERQPWTDDGRRPGRINDIEEILTLTGGLDISPNLGL